jgi:N-acetyl-1-D-myo-inositol-2-amino-2-deoxy-alpha-D-glucopyranoside deacetylase
MENPRLLFVHAHPDDETLTTGATIAHYVARGAHVQVVTCTLGEEGEVIDDRFAQLTVDRADQLGGYRIGELSTALACLGVAEPRFLGGAGRWRDSGMVGTPPRHRQRFVDADPRETVGALVAIIRELRPHVVVTYDPNGGYGHPDHVHAHQVTTAAVAAAAGSGHAGEPWQVPKFYWTVAARSAVERAMRELAGLELPAHWTLPTPEEFRFATQVTVADGGRACALSNDIALPVSETEHFVLASGTAGQRDDRGWETDLLAGVNLG